MVTVVPRTRVAIIVNNGQVAGGGTTTTSVTPSQSTEVVELHQLADVVESSPTTGAVPRYNQLTNKYDITKLSIADLDSTGNLDGGEF